MVGLVAAPAVPPAAADGAEESDATEADSTVPAPERSGMGAGAVAAVGAGASSGGATAQAGSIAAKAKADSAFVNFMGRCVQESVPCASRCRLRAHVSCAAGTALA